MRNTLIVYFLLLSNILFSQEYSHLNDECFVDFRKLENGKIEIKKYLNPELNKRWLTAQKEYKENQNSDAYEFIKNNYDEAHKSENIDLTEGQYLLNNSYEKFGFEIDENKQFTKIAKYQIKENGELSDIKFQNGKVISFETVSLFDEPLKKITINDSLFIEIIYKNGKIFRKNLTNIVLGGGQSNQVRIHYYSNGNIELEQNNIENTFKTFHENGEPELYRDYTNHEEIEYDNEGQKTKHSYISENEKCMEIFEKGIIQLKECDSSDKLKTYSYHYKLGKLEYYEVLDRTKDEIRIYDKNDKLIKTTETGKNPSVN